VRAKEPRVDRRIRVSEVLVIDEEGKKLGVMPTHEALTRAQGLGLNLVEVAPNSRPPVCRILDYGKYKYDQKQANKRKKANQVVVETKEVKFRPKIERHDFDFKLRHVGRFLSEGNKVKCTIMFRGRELAHTDLGEVMLRKVLGELEGKVLIEQEPRLEGRNMTMFIAPKVGAWPKKERPSEKVEDGEPDESFDGVDEDLGLLDADAMYDEEADAAAGSTPTETRPDA
jgi:translation initiation factor IF-3